MRVNERLVCVIIVLSKNGKLLVFSLLSPYILKAQSYQAVLLLLREQYTGGTEHHEFITDGRG